jgi:hypothetical protein
MKDFGIILFGHTRPLLLADVLKSLQKQNALQYVDVWLDGHQGVPEVKRKTELVYEVVSKFPVANIYRHNGAMGFRKMVLQALSHAVQSYRHILILEDDCFPTRDAIKIFRKELMLIENDPEVFSVYGHHFLTPSETEICNRFQGWGWATTSEKLTPFVEQLVDLYSLTEDRYLAFVDQKLTPEIRQRIDITPPRQPSFTLTKFFAWDETLCLLTALADMVHKKTAERTIYNCGASKDSSRFKNVDWYGKPPFNMISHEDVWEYY